MSDSHDNIDNLSSAVDTANSMGCTCLIHLGDIVAPMTAAVLKRFKGEITAVFGNCDDDRIEIRKMVNLAGGHIEKPPLKIHLNGTQYILMHEPRLLEEMIKSGEPDFIFFGHTHEPCFRREGKTVIINPGEIAGIKNSPTFFVLNIHSKKFEKIDL